MEFKLSLPKLEDLALSKIVVSLWNHETIRDLILSCELPDLKWGSYPSWSDISQKVLELAKTLELSGQQKKRLYSFIRPIGKEIERNLYIYSECPQHLCWTPQGTVDDTASALACLQDLESLPIEKRFHVACQNCLEPQIRKLWSEMKRDEFLEKYENRGFSLELFWAYEINGELHKLDAIKNRKTSVYEYVFHYLQINENNATTAARFFFNKLTREQKIRHLEFFFNFGDNSDIFCFMTNELRQIDPELHEDMITENPSRVLERLLEWPWQEHFLPVARFLRNKLDVLGTVHIIRRLNDQICISDCDYLIQERLSSFWLLLPVDLRTEVMDTPVISTDILEQFATRDDARNLKLFLHDAAASTKEDILFSFEGLFLCSTLFYLAAENGNYKMAEAFVRECIRNEEMAVLLKNEMQRILHTSKTHTDFEHSRLVVGMDQLSHYLNGLYPGAASSDIDYEYSAHD